MQRYLRYAFTIIGGLLVILAVGFHWQMTWATSLWPWPDAPLSYVFISAICAATAAATFWAGLTGELGAAVGGLISLLITFLGMTAFLVEFYLQNGGNRLLVQAILCGIWVLIFAGFYWLVRRYPIRDTRPMPRLLRIAFAIFALILVALGIALVLGVPGLLPWSVIPPTSVLLGWIFIGCSGYFIYGLLRPRWHNACGQLLAFLAADIVLIAPLLAHFVSVQPGQRLSLILAIILIIASGALAIYYLFINRKTRAGEIIS